MGKKVGLIILGVIVVVGLILAVWGIGSYNGLVTKRQNVDAHWAEVQNQMQRRADLIPSTWSSVRGSPSIAAEAR